MTPFTIGPPSLASPPPSESAQTIPAYLYRSYDNVNNSLAFMSKEDEKYILDPGFRSRTKLGKYVDEQKLVASSKPRGPDPFPPSTLKKVPENFLDTELDDGRYTAQPPSFTLEHFIVDIAKVSKMPVPKLRQIMYSKHNYKKLTDLLQSQVIRPHMQTKVNNVVFDPKGNHFFISSFYLKSQRSLFYLSELYFFPSLLLLCL